MSDLGMHPRNANLHFHRGGIRVPFLSMPALSIDRHVQSQSSHYLIVIVSALYALPLPALLAIPVW